MPLERAWFVKAPIASWLRRRVKGFTRWAAPLISSELENYHLEKLRQRLDVRDREFFAQWPVTITGDVCVGDRVSMAAYVHIWGEGGVSIGSGVMIGSHTAIVSITHDLTLPEMWKTEQLGSVHIADNVWIGAHCVILPGVTIGRGSVVGAGTIVTRSVPANAIVTGVPGAVRRDRLVRD